MDLFGSRETTHESRFMVASLCKNAMIIGLVVFKLQISDFFVYHAWKFFSCAQKIRFWRCDWQNLGNIIRTPNPRNTRPWRNDAFSAVFGLDQTCHMLAFVGLYRRFP